MTATETTPQSRLRTLLYETPADPAAAARELATARAALAIDSEQAGELLGLEQRWLEGFRETAGPELQQDLVAVRRDWLALRIRHLCAAPPQPAVLLDLAEARAAAAYAAEQDLVRQCEHGLERGFLQLANDIGDHEVLVHEVAERFALLATTSDEIAIEHQIELLRSTGRLVQSMAAVASSKPCRRFARRMLRAADDRELARRMERRLGRRGVAWLESTNFVLLMVVLVTLLVEATVELSPATAYVFQWVDALACAFFIADFLFEIALHPSRWSWFWRNALTDLVPAIPSVLFLLPSAGIGAAADNLLMLRVLRLLRVTWAARYVQALRPLLRSARLLLFLVRGLDGLAARFAQILNREFVFVPAASDEQRSPELDDLRDMLFGALRREHELIGLLPQRQRNQLLHERIAEVRRAMGVLQPSAFHSQATSTAARDVPIGEAIEFLWALREQDIGRWLERSDVQALDRVVRVLSVAPVRWLPIISRLAVHPLPDTPEQRIVELGRRVAEWLEAWHGRMLFLADLHGIVTGPQILDRVAGAMVKATQRPAVRLLLFGGLFLLFDLLIKSATISAVLGKIVGLPLILLGSFCLIFLSVGHWLKRLAGQASENYRLTSEAHFISQLERVQSRYEQEDLDFLTTRAFGDGVTGRHARKLLATQLGSARTGVPVADDVMPYQVALDCNRMALLYLHFLDGAPLHISDVKTTEQLLANQSLENLRREFLRQTPAEKRSLRKLKLDDGTLFSGPYLWFRFITESVAVEVAKRIAGYNSFCIPLAQLPAAPPEAITTMQDWLQRRRDPRGGRTPKDRQQGERRLAYPTTEFTALDFLGGDEERDRHLAAMFGEEVLEVIRFDRRTMVREIFGTRPVNHLPKHERSFNPLRFYEQRLSNGRVLLAPLLLLWRSLRTMGWFVGKLRQSVREVLDPDLAMHRRQIGEAPFEVALRKIHRMKAPGLIEAIRLRLRLDAIYSGAPVGWTGEASAIADPELERDLRFLHLRERQAAQLREQAQRVRHQVAALHAAIAWLPPLWGQDLGEPDAETRRAGELAATCAWIADKDHARTLLFAERWRAESLPALCAVGLRLSWSRRAWAWLCGRFVVHPVDAWLERHGRDLPRDTRRVLRAAYATDQHGTREVINAWHALPAESSPTENAIATLRHAYRNGAAVGRDLIALRTVQSLAIIDVRNYRELVFLIGDYAADGESSRLGRGLP